MFFHRVFTPSLAIYSYLVGDDKTKRCVVIDPTRHVTPYLVEAQNQGFEITDILETHCHADFISGAKELKHQLNDKPCIHVSARGGKEAIPLYADHSVQEGEMVQMGDLRFEPLHTPGHTPEHLTWICYDETRHPEIPAFAFTGDCLFVGSVGRADLLGESQNLTLTKQLYQTLFQTLARFPDFLEIFPTHGAGSLCGQQINSRESSTLGYERRCNPYLQKRGEEEWVQRLQKGLPAVPPYFKRVKQSNLAGPPLLKSLKMSPWKEGESPAFDQLFLVDIRHPELFALSHFKGALNFPFSSHFSQWVGWMLPADLPLGIISENAHLLPDVMNQLRLMGFDQEIYSIPFDQQAPVFSHLLASSSMIESKELHAALSSPPLFYLLDVRSRQEWEVGHILEAHHLELPQLAHALDALPKDQPIAVICRTGMRASLGASLLKKEGFEQAVTIRGGMEAWKQEGLPLVQ